MSEDNKKSISEQADEIRKELDALIGEGQLDVETDPSDLPVTQRETSLAPVNYTEIKRKALNGFSRYLLSSQEGKEVRYPSSYFLYNVSRKGGGDLF